MQFEDMKSRFIAGEKIYYTDAEDRAILYLAQDLDRDEAAVFLIAARKTGIAPFEDDREGQYALHYASGKYYLTQQ